MRSRRRRASWQSGQSSRSCTRQSPRPTTTVRLRLRVPHLLTQAPLSLTVHRRLPRMAHSTLKAVNSTRRLRNKTFLILQLVLHTNLNNSQIDHKTSQATWREYHYLKVNNHTIVSHTVRLKTVHTKTRLESLTVPLKNTIMAGITLLLPIPSMHHRWPNNNRYLRLLGLRRPLNHCSTRTQIGLVVGSPVNCTGIPQEMPVHRRAQQALKITLRGPCSPQVHLNHLRKSQPTKVNTLTNQTTACVTHRLQRLQVGLTRTLPTTCPHLVNTRLALIRLGATYTQHLQNKLIPLSRPESCRAVTICRARRDCHRVDVWLPKVARVEIKLTRKIVRLYRRTCKRMDSA